MSASTSDGGAVIEGLHVGKRLASPEEIAQSALYLASDQSSFTTGAALLVDGRVSITRTEPGLLSATSTNVIAAARRRKRPTPLPGVTPVRRIASKHDEREETGQAWLDARVRQGATSTRW